MRNEIEFYIHIASPISFIVPCRLIIFRGYPTIRIVGNISASIKPLKYYLYAKIRKSKILGPLQTILLVFPKDVPIDDPEIFTTLSNHITMLIQLSRKNRSLNKPPILIGMPKPPKILPHIYHDSNTLLPSQIYIPNLSKTINPRPVSINHNNLLFSKSRSDISLTTIKPQIPDNILQQLINLSRHVYSDWEGQYINNIPPFETLSIKNLLKKLRHPAIYTTYKTSTLVKIRHLPGIKILLSNTCKCTNFLFNSGCVCTKSQLNIRHLTLQKMPKLREIIIYQDPEQYEYYSPASWKNVLKKIF